MNTHLVATATPAELHDLDVAEEALVSHWRTLIGRQSPDLIASMIVAAHDFDPRWGATMESCQNPWCDRFVLESLRDPGTGFLFCPDGCEDDAAHAAEERRHTVLRAEGAVAATWPVIR